MTSIPWSQPGWLDEASAWIHTESVRLKMRVVGPSQQLHVRPWSTILRVPTDTGTIYFKAIGACEWHEPALTDALARWRPDCMLPVLAVDVERGWLLLAEGGPTLRTLIRADKDASRWRTILPVYADVQIELADRVQELLALGVPDRRLAQLPVLYAQLLTDIEVLRIDQNPGLTSDEYQRLRALAPRFATMCEALAEYGIPETLHHGDLHDNNVFWQAGRPIFFDWGDSCLSHPFFSLRTVLVSLENSLGEEAAAAIFGEFLDTYLDQWTRYGSREDLREARRLAYVVGVVNGAVTYQRGYATLDAAQREEYAEPVPSLLQEFLGEVEGTTAYSLIG